MPPFPHDVSRDIGEALALAGELVSQVLSLGVTSPGGVGSSSSELVSTDIASLPMHPCVSRFGLCGSANGVARSTTSAGHGRSLAKHVIRATTRGLCLQGWPLSTSLLSEPKSMDSEFLRGLIDCITKLNTPCIAATDGLFFDSASTDCAA